MQPWQKVDGIENPFAAGVNTPAKITEASRAALRAEKSNGPANRSVAAINYIAPTSLKNP
jgi:hypothetical protein